MRRIHSDKEVWDNYLKVKQFTGMTDKEIAMAASDYLVKSGTFDKLKLKRELDQTKMKLETIEEIRREMRR